MLRLIGTIVAIVGGATLLKEVLKEEKHPSISGIPKENLNPNYLIKFRNTDKLGIIKQRITRNINIIIEKCDSFKIGKTGNKKTRPSNYLDFNEMYFLCESNEKNINLLEAHYIDEYFDHKKNKNQRRGSAGRMVSSNGKFYLYLVVS